jgi:hypothetical protein
LGAGGRAASGRLGPPVPVATTTTTTTTVTNHHRHGDHRHCEYHRDHHHPSPPWPHPSPPHVGRRRVTVTGSCCGVAFQRPRAHGTTSLRARMTATAPAQRNRRRGCSTHRQASLQCLLGHFGFLGLAALMAHSLEPLRLLGTRSRFGRRRRAGRPARVRLPRHLRRTCVRARACVHLCVRERTRAIALCLCVHACAQVGTCERVLRSQDRLRARARARTGDLRGAVRVGVERHRQRDALPATSRIGDNRHRVCAQRVAPPMA